MQSETRKISELQKAITVHAEKDLRNHSRCRTGRAPGLNPLTAASQPCLLGKKEGRRGGRKERKKGEREGGREREREGRKEGKERERKKGRKQERKRKEGRKKKRNKGKAGGEREKA